MTICITESTTSVAKGRDVDQLEAIYRRNVRRVRWVLRSRGVGEPMLDDLVQEVFVALHRRLPARDPAVSISAFVAAVARNVAYSHRRAVSRRLEATKHVEPPEPPDAPDVELARRRAAVELQAFIDGLPPKQREAFVLGEVLGMTVPEIQRLVRVPADTLYSRLKAARKRFSARFGPDAKSRRWVRATDRSDVAKRDRVWLAIATGLPVRSGLLGAAALRWALAVAASATAAVGIGRLREEDDGSAPKVMSVQRRPASPSPTREPEAPEVVVASVEIQRPQATPPSTPRRAPRKRPPKPTPPTLEASPDDATDSLAATVRALRDAKAKIRGGDVDGARALLSKVEPAPELAHEWQLLMTTSNASGAKASDDNP